MSEIIEQKTYWVRLMVQNKNKIVWSGKSLPLPLETTEVGPLRRVYIQGKKSLLCNIENVPYIIGDIFSVLNTSCSEESGSKVNNLEQQVHGKLKEVWNTQSSQKFAYPYQGFKIEFSGRLGGVNKTRKAKLVQGSLKPQSFNSKIQYRQKALKTKWGLWGCTITLN